jgi:hypothetical protein
MTRSIPGFIPSIVPAFIKKAGCYVALAFLLLGVSDFAIAQTAAKSSATGQHSAEAGQKTFSSAEAASTALYDAAKSGDTDALLAIFGPGGRDLVFSGDEVLDKNGRETFVERYEEMHRLVQDGPKIYKLDVGADNWPLPIPIVEANNTWFYDTASGKEEVLYRRIGKNELSVIETCATLVGAQIEYATEPREPSTKKVYAAKFISDPGTHDGLYWNAGESDASPIGPLIADASAQGYTKKTEPYEGYYFRILTKQGAAAPGGTKDYMHDGELEHGFAFLMYPAEYRNSGVMTFIVNKDGIVYEKDLGPNTASLAKAMTTYNPDKTWKKVE